MGCVLKQGNSISYFKSRPCHICCNLWWPSAICLIVKQWKAIWVSWQTNHTQPPPILFLFSSSFIFFFLFTECVPTWNLSSGIYQRRLYTAYRTELLGFCYSGNSWVVSYKIFLCEFCSKHEVSLKGLLLEAKRKDDIWLSTYVAMTDNETHW